MLRFKLLNFFMSMWYNKLVLLHDDSILLTYDILKNKISWKSWLNPRFSQNFKSKWALKWLPLDRGYFKFYFHKGKSILIISCRTYLWTLEFVLLFKSHVCMAMHFIPVKCLAFRYYWSTVPRKRGDMETLARSSVSLSPQLKVKFKLTVSR